MHVLYTRSKKGVYKCTLSEIAVVKEMFYAEVVIEILFSQFDYKDYAT